MNEDQPLNGGAAEPWHPSARSLWATVNKMPPGHKIVSDEEMMLMMHSMRNQTTLNAALARDFKARNAEDDRLLAGLVKVLSKTIGLPEKIAPLHMIRAQELNEAVGILKAIVGRLEDRVSAQNGREKK